MGVYDKRLLFLELSRCGQSSVEINISDDIVNRSYCRLKSLGHKLLRLVDANGCLVMEFAGRLYECGNELDELTRQKLMFFRGKKCNFRRHTFLFSAAFR